MRSSYDNETIEIPTCFCGSYASLKISWTEKNPGRRFFNCGNYRTGQCRFFDWYDNPPSPWFHSTLLELLQRIDHLERIVENQRLGRTPPHTPMVEPNPVVEPIVSSVKMKYVIPVIVVVFILVAMKM